MSDDKRFPRVVLMRFLKGDSVAAICFSMSADVRRVEHLIRRALRDTNRKLQRATGQRKQDKRKEPAP